MTGKILCLLGLHHWLHNAFGMAPPSCRRCGKTFVEQSIEPITDPDDYRLIGMPFYQCQMFLKQNYPEIAEPFRLLQTEPLWVVSEWLDKHFPLKEGRWGTRLISDLYLDLRAQVEGRL